MNISFRPHVDGSDQSLNTRRGFLSRTAAAVAAGATLGSISAAEAQVPVVINMDQRASHLPTLYRGWLVKNFHSIQKHENDHVAFLVGQLGDHARPKPTFQNLEQPNVVAFAYVSQAFENTGVKAYLAAAPVISSRTILGQAASIAEMEARHAGWLNTLLNDYISVSNESFESPLTQQQVVGRVAPFIADLNSDIPLMFSSTPSPANDIAILNFALALEYLEAEFYNINVPKFS